MQKGLSLALSAEFLISPRVLSKGPVKEWKQEEEEEKKTKKKENNNH